MHCNQLVSGSEPGVGIRPLHAKAAGTRVDASGARGMSGCKLPDRCQTGSTYLPGFHTHTPIEQNVHCYQGTRYTKAGLLSFYRRGVIRAGTGCRLAYHPRSVRRTSGQHAPKCSHDAWLVSNMDARVQLTRPRPGYAPKLGIPAVQHTVHAR